MACARMHYDAMKVTHYSLNMGNRPVDVKIFALSRYDSHSKIIYKNALWGKTVGGIWFECLCFMFVFRPHLRGQTLPNAVWTHSV